MCLHDMIYCMYQQSGKYHMARAIWKFVYQIEVNIIINSLCYTDARVYEVYRPLKASGVVCSRKNLLRLLVKVIPMLYCSFLFSAIDSRAI